VVVLDEGHRLKSLSSQVAHCLHGVRSKRRVVLSGTPLQNNLDEYFAMLSWCRPGDGNGGGCER
jgi:SNF2 family DNA or RNA helicase